MLGKVINMKTSYRTRYVDDMITRKSISNTWKAINQYCLTEDELTQWCDLGYKWFKHYRVSGPMINKLNHLYYLSKLPQDKRDQYRDNNKPYYEEPNMKEIDDLWVLKCDDNRES